MTEVIKTRILCQQQFATFRYPGLNKPTLHTKFLFF